MGRTGLSQLEKLDVLLLCLKQTQSMKGQPQHSLLPHAHCRSASYLDEGGDDESQFPFVLMANNLENSPCLLRTVNDASEITSEIVIKENSRRERETHTESLTTASSESLEVTEPAAASPIPQTCRRIPKSLLNGRGSGVQPPGPPHSLQLQRKQWWNSRYPGAGEATNPTGGHQEMSRKLSPLKTILEVEQLT